MGWCSGTPIFDRTVKALLETSLPDAEKQKVIEELSDSMWDHDWDCEGDSHYYNNPIVRAAWLKLNPEDWQEIFDEEEINEDWSEDQHLP